MYNYFDIDTSARDFGVFSGIVGVWQDKCRDKQVPAWKSFHPSDLLGWQTYLAVSEAEGCRQDVRFLYFGAGAAVLQGADYTGKSLSEALPIAYESLYKAHITLMLASPKVAIARTPAGGHAVKQYFLRILHLPLSDDGIMVNRLMHFVQRDETSEN